MTLRTLALKLLDRYFDAQLAIAMLALVVMMLVTVVDVALRYLVNAPVRGSYDIVEISLVISVFFGIASVIAGRHEILIDLIDGMIPPGAVRALIVFAQLLAVRILVFVFWSMLRPARDAYQYGDVKLELGLPVWLIWVIALFGLFNGILAAVSSLFRPASLRVARVVAEHAE